MYRFSINAKRSLVQINSGESSNELMAKAIVYLKSISAMSASLHHIPGSIFGCVRRNWYSYADK